MKALLLLLVSSLAFAAPERILDGQKLKNGLTTWTLPTTDGTANQCIRTNGSKVLSFGTCAGGGGLDLNPSLTTIDVNSGQFKTYIGPQQIGMRGPLYITQSEFPVAYAAFDNGSATAYLGIDGNGLTNMAPNQPLFHSPVQNINISVGNNLTQIVSQNTIEQRARVGIGGPPSPGSAGLDIQSPDNGGDTLIVRKGTTGTLGAVVIKPAVLGGDLLNIQGTNSGLTQANDLAIQAEGGNLAVGYPPSTTSVNKLGIFNGSLELRPPDNSVASKGGLVWMVEPLNNDPAATLTLERTGFSGAPHDLVFRNTNTHPTLSERLRIASDGAYYFKDVSLPSASNGYIWQLIDQSTGQAGWAPAAGGGGGETYEGSFGPEFGSLSFTLIKANGWVTMIAGGKGNFSFSGPGGLEDADISENGMTAVIPEGFRPGSNPYDDTCLFDFLRGTYPSLTQQKGKIEIYSNGNMDAYFMPNLLNFDSGGDQYRLEAPITCMWKAAP